LSDALRSLWPNIEITLNSKVPRKGAFEFVLTKSDGSGMGIEITLKTFYNNSLVIEGNFMY
jgi:hypothetical protein